jgi:hypothetical protein
MDWKFSISPVVWQVHEEGLEYVHGKEVDQDWAFGVRLNLAYDTCCAGTIEIDWTYYRTTEHSTIKNASPIWSYTPIETFDQVRGDTKLTLNLLDARLGTDFYPTCFLTLHPFFALSSGWIDQDFMIRGINDSITMDKVTMENDFWGIGPKVGFKSLWELGCGFSLFGNADVTLFYGDFTVRQKEKTEHASSHPSLCSYKDTFWLSRAFVDLIIGIDWEWIFCSCDYSIGFAAGWETLFFFGQNQLKRPLSHQRERGDLRPVIILALLKETTSRLWKSC